MNIASILSLSTIDYPGHLSSVVYTQGCNFNCAFCYNKGLIPYAEESCVSIQDAFGKIEDCANIVDSVVITGGEPTIHECLPSFVGVLKRMGLEVKLNTNGSNPLMIKTMLFEGKLDHVTMDIKAPFSKYPLVCGGDVNVGLVRESLEWLKQYPFDNVDFRTTYAPTILSEEDMADIIALVDGQKTHIIQPCRKVSDA